MHALVASHGLAVGAVGGTIAEVAVWATDANSEVAGIRTILVASTIVLIVGWV
jgi:hypothetical protein